MRLFTEIAIIFIAAWFMLASYDDVKWGILSAAYDLGIGQAPYTQELIEESRYENV